MPYDPVRIREVGPRDGFQNEPETIPTADKVRLVEGLARTGLRRLEVTSFVRADVIPQLADGPEVLRAADIPDEVDVSVLIPNERGLEHALALRDHFDEVNLFLSASETHNRKNVNRSIEESLTGLERVIARARSEGLRCEGVISVAFGCPYEGDVPRERVFSIARRLKEAGCEEIAFGDTTGMANPTQVREMYGQAAEQLSGVELTAHFHNTRGQGLANAVAALEAGVRSLRVVIRRAGRMPRAARRHRQRGDRGPRIDAPRDGTSHGHRPRSAARLCPRCPRGSRAPTGQPPAHGRARGLAPSVTLRADVEALAGMSRRSASQGERESAEWCAARLRHAGAQEVRTEPFRYQHTFGYAHALHCAAALAGRAAAAAALLSFELELSGRSQWLRRVLPTGEGANVVGRLPARGERRRTLVLVAHHDAAHTGLMWNPRLATGAVRDGRPPFSLLPEVAMAAVAFGPRRVRAPARAVLALATALSLEVAHGDTVPGASDNATGVAAVIALVERLVADPLDGTEVAIVLPGCEESGMGGMAAWLRSARSALDPAPRSCSGWTRWGRGSRWSPARRGRCGAFATAKRTWTCSTRAPCAPVWSRPAAFDWVAGPIRCSLGWRACPPSRCSRCAATRFNDYHLPTDIPERVDWDSVERCLAIAESAAREWAAAHA